MPGGPLLGWPSHAAVGGRSRFLVTWAPLYGYLMVLRHGCWLLVELVVERVTGSPVSSMTLTKP